MLTIAGVGVALLLLALLLMPVYLAVSASSGDEGIEVLLEGRWFGIPFGGEFPRSGGSSQPPSARSRPRRRQSPRKFSWILSRPIARIVRALHLRLSFFRLSLGGEDPAEVGIALGYCSAFMFLVPSEMRRRVTVHAAFEEDRTSCQTRFRLWFFPGVLLFHLLTSR